MFNFYKIGLKFYTFNIYFNDIATLEVALFSFEQINSDIYYYYLDLDFLSVTGM